MALECGSLPRDAGDLAGLSFTGTLIVLTTRWIDANVGVKDDGIVPYCHNVAPKSTLETVTFTADNILSVINKLKPNLFSGPDRLPPEFFKNLKFCLAGPLAQMFNQLISVGAVPKEWKTAIIVPGLTGDVANYRPISLTSVPCKLMERIIAQHICDHLINCNCCCLVHNMVFSRPYLRSRYCYTVASVVVVVVCLSSVTLCIVTKRCVLEQKLLWRAYRKSYMRNRLVPK